MEQIYKIYINVLYIHVYFCLKPFEKPLHCRLREPRSKLSYAPSAYRFLISALIRLRLTGVMPRYVARHSSGILCSSSGLFLSRAW